eukprot:TRINITY_DN9237_c0_g1_i1.p1 TRINITY_DN9237_c0_g1~~TRINITY_DN9237_c0_g1_i1.p1  ORF type:complete len:289 (+),score=26.77 TRINITY_DN9237_c0_g1_i1:24-890(+)
MAEGGLVWNDPPTCALCDEFIYGTKTDVALHYAKCSEAFLNNVKKLKKTNSSRHLKPGSDSIGRSRSKSLGSRLSRFFSRTASSSSTADESDTVSAETAPPRPTKNPSLRDSHHLLLPDNPPISTLPIVEKPQGSLRTSTDNIQSSVPSITQPTSSQGYTQNIDTTNQHAAPTNQPAGSQGYTHNMQGYTHNTQGYTQNYETNNQNSAPPAPQPYVSPASNRPNSMKLPPPLVLPDTVNKASYNEGRPASVVHRNISKEEELHDSPSLRRRSNSFSNARNNIENLFGK